MKWLQLLNLRLVLRMVVFAAPAALLIALGCLWLYERHWLLLFVAIDAAVALAGWVAIKTLDARRPRKSFDARPPSDRWPPAGIEAWKDVQTLADRRETAPPALDDRDAWLAAFIEAFEVVARRFHPDSKRPALEAPITGVLQVVERVARLPGTNPRPRAAGRSRHDRRRRPNLQVGPASQPSDQRGVLGLSRRAALHKSLGGNPQ